MTDSSADGVWPNPAVDRLEALQDTGNDDEDESKKANVPHVCENVLCNVLSIVEDTVALKVSYDDSDPSINAAGAANRLFERLHSSDWVEHICSVRLDEQRCVVDMYPQASRKPAMQDSSSNIHSSCLHPKSKHIDAFLRDDECLCMPNLPKKPLNALSPCNRLLHRRRVTRLLEDHKSCIRDSIGNHLASFTRSDHIMPAMCNEGRYPDIR